MLKIGMLSLAFAMIVTPIASAETGAGVTVEQHKLACSANVDTDRIRWLDSEGRVVVDHNCSTVHAEYDASRNLELACRSVNVLRLLPPVFDGPITQIQTLPDNPSPYGPDPQYADPSGCWLAVGAQL